MEKSAGALEGAATLHELNGTEDVDILPRDEVFLISSFMLNLRLAAYVISPIYPPPFPLIFCDSLTSGRYQPDLLNLYRSQTLDMLRHSRILVEARKERKDKRGLHWPDVGFKRWLSTGSAEETETISAAEPLRGRTAEDMEEDVFDASDDDDDDDDPVSPWKNTLVDPGAKEWASAAKATESDHKQERQRRGQQVKKDMGVGGVSGNGRSDSASGNGSGSTAYSIWMKGRGWLADFVDWVKDSENVLYAFKFTFGIMLVTWPAFVMRWALWYEQARAGEFNPFLFSVCPY